MNDYDADFVEPGPPPLLQRGNSRQWRDARNQMRNSVAPLLARNRKDFFSMTVVIIYFTLVNFIPEWSGADRAENCLAGPKLLAFNNYFAWLIMGSWLTIKLLFSLVVWRRASNMRMRGTVEEYLPRLNLIFMIIEVFYYLIAIPVWFYWSFTIWSTYNGSACFQGWNFLDFFNLMLIYLYSFSFAIAAVIVIPCVICCLPSIISNYNRR